MKEESRIQLGMFSVLYFMFKPFFHTLRKSINKLNKNMSFSRSTDAFELKFSGYVQ